MYKERWMASSTQKMIVQLQVSHKPGSPAMGTLFQPGRENQGIFLFSHWKIKEKEKNTHSTLLLNAMRTLAVELECPG